MPYDHDQIDNLDAVIDDLDDPTTLETWDATDPYDSGMVAASAVRRALARSSGATPVVEDHAPASPIVSLWDVVVAGTPTGGTFTLIIGILGADPIETNPIDFDSSTADLETAIHSTAGLENVQVTGTDPLPEGEQQLDFTTYGGGPVTVETGDNSLSGGTDPAPELSEAQTGSYGDQGHPQTTTWFDTDAKQFYANFGDATTPNWQAVGPTAFSNPFVGSFTCPIFTTNDFTGVLDEDGREFSVANDNSDILLNLTRAREIILGAQSAGPLTAGLHAIFLDPTPGSAALVIQAQDSDGTPVSASVPLTP